MSRSSSTGSLPSCVVVGTGFEAKYDTSDVFVVAVGCEVRRVVTWSAVSGIVVFVLGVLVETVLVVVVVLVAATVGATRAVLPWSAIASSRELVRTSTQYKRTL